MGKPNEFTTVFESLQRAFPVDQATIEESFKTAAGYGERFAAVTLDAASKSSDITAQAVKDTIANLRDLSSVRDDASAYVTAFADFTQKQVDLVGRVAEGLGTVAQETQASASELVSEAAKAAEEQVPSQVKAVARPAKAASEKVA